MLGGENGVVGIGISPIPSASSAKVSGPRFTGTPFRPPYYRRRGFRGRFESSFVCAWGSCTLHGVQCEAAPTLFRERSMYHDHWIGI